MERSISSPSAADSPAAHDEEKRNDQCFQQNSDRDRRLARHRRGGGGAAGPRRLHRRRQLFRRRGARRGARPQDRGEGRPRADRQGRCQRPAGRARHVRRRRGGVRRRRRARQQCRHHDAVGDRRHRRCAVRSPDQRQPQRHVQHVARSGPAAARRRPHRQFLVERRRPAAADLWRLCRHQGGRRGDDRASSPRNCAAATSRSMRSRRARRRPICSSTASRRN